MTCRCKVFLICAGQNNYGICLSFRFLFQPDSCTLHKYNGRQAAVCLRNKRLILIGDSMAWSQFESLACMLGPGAIAVNGTRMMDAKHFMQFQDSKYRGDLLLPGNASVHMRGINKFDDGARWRNWLRDLGGLSSTDVLVVNWGSHYTLHGSFEDYKQEMQRIILGELRQLPCQIYWREYSPTHFGGPSGKFTHDPNVKACAPAETGETEYNDWTRQVLANCEAACAHIRLLPIWGPSLGRFGSHAGDHIPEKNFGFWVKAVRHDCRHFCLNVLDVWNQILLNMMCSPAVVRAPTLRALPKASIAH